MIGVLTAFALLLGAAGLAKLRRPAQSAKALSALGIPGVSLLTRTPVTRLAGLTELLIAAYVVGWGGPMAAALLTAAYLTLAATSWRMVKVAPGQDCGCFGQPDQPISHWHTAVNAAGALTGATAAIWPQQALATIAADQHGLALAAAALSVLLAWLAYLTMTALPYLARLRRNLAPTP